MISDSHSIALVTGATGAVGQALIEALRQLGISVRGYGRNRPKISLCQDFVVGDINDRVQLAEAMRGVDCVFHLAALLHINNPTTDMKRLYWETNVDGTRTVCEAASEGGVRRTIVYSTINVYVGSFGMGLLNEATPPNPTNWYAESKLASEKIALSFPGTDVLRLAPVYGRGLKGNYGRYLRLAQRGVIPIVGSGGNRQTLIHAVDVARASIACASRTKISDSAMNLCDLSPYSLNEIAESISRAIKNRPRIVHVPKWAAIGVATLLERGLGLIGKNSPIGPAQIERMCEDVAVDGSALWQELGMAPAVSLVDGWRDAAGELNVIETLESARHCQRAA